MKIERKKLLTALEPLKAALAVRTVVEAQTQIWFTKTGSVFAHDGGFGVRVEIELPFSFGVPGKLLIGLLEQSEAQEVSLEEVKESLVLKAGKSTTKLATLDLDSCPKSVRDLMLVETTDAPLAQLIVSKELVNGMRRVFMLRPAEAKRLEHHGVSIFPAGDEIDLITTDSKAIAVMPVKQKFSKKTVIPRVFAEQMVVRCDEGAVVELYEDHFFVKATDTLMLFSNVFDTSQMQDLPRIIDGAYDTKAAPPFTIPKGFEAALERAGLMASAKEDVLVDLTTKDKVLTISGKFNAGAFSEDFHVDKALPDRKVTVLAKPLMTTAVVNKLMVGPNAVALCGTDDFLYFLALGA